MEITQIVVIGIVSAILSLVIKQHSPQYSILISIIASIIIIFFVFPKLSAVLTILNRISSNINTQTDYIGVIFKVIGISYIAEFGSQICIDSGETSIASKIDLGGKILIMAISAPVLLSLLDVVLNFLP